MPKGGGGGSGGSGGSGKKRNAAEAGWAGSGEKASGGSKKRADSTGAKAISGYFPKAKVLKTGGAAALAGSDSVSILLFYTYVEPLWSEARQSEAVEMCVRRGAELKLGGRIRVAREGFNATVSGTHDAVRAFAATLRRWDAKGFAGTDFKYVDGEPLTKHFPELKVFPVVELVHYGLNPRTAPPLSTGAQHLDAAAFHAKLLEPDTVVIDVRNHYETNIGRFVAPDDGAQMLDPKMRVSTEFPAWSAEARPQLAGKQVLMYCTGGIRCERASGLVRQLTGESTKGVFQLQGGIEKYLATFPDGGLWQGKNFTFDKRGDLAASTTAQAAAQEAAVLSVCCACCKPWDTYLGKRKCSALLEATGKPCGVPVLVCEDCLTARVSAETLKCPLCVPSKRRPAASAAPSKHTHAANGKKKKKPAAKTIAARQAAAEANAQAAAQAAADGQAPPPTKKKKKRRKKNKKKPEAAGEAMQGDTTE